MDESLTLFNIRQIIHKEFPEHKAGLLGENLGIPHDNVETLKHDSGNDSNKFFSKVITYWLHSDREKSWRKLADAVELCNYEDVADKIREKYVKLATAEHRLPQGIYFRELERDHQLYQRTLPSSPTACQKTHIQGSSEESVQNISNNTGLLNARETVSDQLKILEDNFITLQESLLTELKARKISVDLLTTKISCLKNDVNRYVYNSWRKIVDRNFGNLNALFTDLNAKVWTILDYYLLGHIIEYLENEELKKKLENYTKQLNTFKKRTHVSDFTNCWRVSQIKPDIPDFENISIQYDEAPETLADLDEFRNSFKTRFFPSLIDCSSCIYYGKFQQKSSVSAITLYIPNEMAKELLTKADKTSQLFRMYKVSKMLVGNTEVFNRGEPSIKDTETQTGMDMATLKTLEIQIQDYRFREENTQRELEESNAQTVKSKKRVEELEKVVEELEKLVEDTSRKLEANKKIIDACNESVEESNKRAMMSDRKAEDATRRAMEAINREENTNKRAEASERRENDAIRRAEVCEGKVKDVTRRAEESEKRERDAIRRAGVSERRERDAIGRAGVSEGRERDAIRRAEMSERRENEAIGRINDATRRAEAAEEAQRQVEDVIEVVHHVERSITELKLSSSTNRLIRREEIELTGPELGVGTWATVTVGKFRGINVAAKIMHNQIISHDNILNFQREMNIAAQLQHPNLIQFIGATIEDDVMVLTELMSTSLRSQLDIEEYFQPKLVNAISLDVACALNFLHLIEPDPIIHLNISSANVLLQELPSSMWRAKLTDFCSVNVFCQHYTDNLGSSAYAAPEAAANHCHPSPKMDIFSFGVLILEMLTGRLPVPDGRPSLLLNVHHEQLLRLIIRCLSDNTENRPSASDVIAELRRH